MAIVTETAWKMRLERGTTMVAFRALPLSDCYLLNGKGVRFYNREQLAPGHRVVLARAAAEEVANDLGAEVQPLPTLSGEDEMAIVLRDGHVLGWMYDENTRRVDTGLPDLFSDDAAALESWFLRWEHALPVEAREELAVLLVDVDDKLMD